MKQDETKGIVVYCASSSHIDDIYKAAARETGRLLAEAGLPLVNGGGDTGLMGECINGAVGAGGTTIGVIPQFMADRGWESKKLTRCIVTPDMHSRKSTMASLSIGAIALAGGIGTLDELAEIMTWNQLRIYNHPVVIVNTAGYYNPLLEMFDQMKRQGFMRDDRNLAVVVDTPREAVDLILSADCAR